MMGFISINDAADADWKASLGVRPTVGAFK
jgi:hypothetical protein